MSQKVFPISAIYEDELNDTQYGIYRCLCIVLVLEYTGLLILELSNIWRFLIKQGKWRQKPLLFIYIFATVSTVCRLV